jgi:hypothetical protein
MTANLRNLTREKREVPMKRLLMPAATLTTLKKIAFTLLCCTVLMVFAAPAQAQTPSGPRPGVPGPASQVNNQAISVRPRTTVGPLDVPAQSYDVSGTWLDTYEYLWDLTETQSTGAITGTVIGCDAPLVGTVTGSAVGAQFTLVVTDPPCLNYQYNMTWVSGNSAQGTWFNWCEDESGAQCGGDSVTMNLTNAPITQTLTLTPGPGPNFTNYVFGSYNHKYEYSGANAGDQVTVTAMPSDPEPVNAVLADSNFPTASCIVYDIGKCVVIGVSCLATMGGNDCTTLPYTLRESYNTSQTITGPCLLKTESYPPSPDVWTDIETAFSQMRFDPTNTGRSNGFSYFVVAQNCATVSPASGLNGSNCNGLYTGTYKGNLTVSNGQSCTFTNGGVTGNLTQTGGTVILQSSSFVGGNLQVSGGSLSLSYSTLGKNVQITGGGGFSIGPGVSIGGNLQIQNVPASPGTDQVCGTSVKGNLQFQDSGTATQIGAGGGCPGNTVSGDLTVQNNTASTTVDSNTVGGNLTDQNNTALTQIDSNTVKGNLTDQNNTAGSQVFTNVVTKELRCNGDTAISGGGNTAGSKQGQCATF